MTVSFVYIISLRQSVLSAVNNFFGFTDDEMSSVGFTQIGVAAVAVVIFCTSTDYWENTGNIHDDVMSDALS